MNVCWISHDTPNIVWTLLIHVGITETSHCSLPPCLCHLSVPLLLPPSKPVTVSTGSFTLLQTWNFFPRWQFHYLLLCWWFCLSKRFNILPLVHPCGSFCLFCTFCPCIQHPFLFSRTVQQSVPPGSPPEFPAPFPWPVSLVVFVQKRSSALSRACTTSVNAAVRAQSAAVCPGASSRFHGPGCAEPGWAVPGIGSALLRPGRESRACPRAGGGQRPALSREPRRSPARSAAPRPRHVFPVTIPAGRTRLPAGPSRSAPAGPAALPGPAPPPTPAAAWWARGRVGPRSTGRGGRPGRARGRGYSPRALPAWQHRGAAAAGVWERGKRQTAVWGRGGRWGPSGVTALLLRVGQGRASSGSSSPSVGAFCASSERCKPYEFWLCFGWGPRSLCFLPMNLMNAVVVWAGIFLLSVKCLSGYVHPRWTRQVSQNSIWNLSCLPSSAVCMTVGRCSLGLQTCHLNCTVFPWHICWLLLAMLKHYVYAFT